MRLGFQDQVDYSPQGRTAVSVRDGVIWYLGRELGIEPPEREFSVYRSPATIANAAARMRDIPVTVDHIELDGDAPETGSKVTDAEIIDLVDDEVAARLAIKNALELCPDHVSLLSGKRQLSLGYHAELVEHPEYDFEQRGIMPHHLAIVEAGRCGPLCSFLDKKGTGKMAFNFAEFEKKLKAFKDKIPQPSMGEIAEMAEKVMEGIKKLPVDQLMNFLPMLKQIAEAGSIQSEAAPVEGEAPAESAAEAPAMDAAPPAAPAMAAEEKPQFSDAAVKKIVADKIALRDSVIDKARDFFDSDYSFIGKSTEQIMRDALKLEHGNAAFTDSELPIAFKLLKKPASNRYQKFGDTAVKSALDAVAEKEF